MSLSVDSLLIGGITGLGYALLAVGLVLIYRATRVINFAHGEIGAFGAAVLAKLVLDLGFPYLVGLVVVLVIGAVVGGLVELTVIRRLFDAPRLVVLVATIGVSQVMFVGQLALPDVEQVSSYPVAFERNLQIGDLVLNGGHFAMLAFVPAAAVTLTVFMKRTPYGIAIRAAADNADAARLGRINVRRVSTVVWVLAGLLATVTSVLLGPVRGSLVGVTSVAVGPGLLLRALAAGLVGRLTSMPLALGGGVVIGIVEAVVLVNASNPGVADALLFLAILGFVLFRKPQGDASGEESSWSLVARAKAVPGEVEGISWFSRLRRSAVMGAVGIGVVLPIVFDSSAQVFLFSLVALYAIVGISITIVTGWSGQLTLGQFAIVGVGSMVTALLVGRGMPFGVAVFYATVAGTFVALVVGVPALRVQGMFLGVTTLAFAVAARTFLLPHRLFTGGEAVVLVEAGSLGPLDFSSQRTFYYLCFVLLLGTSIGVKRLRASGVGRAIIAVRDNAKSAAGMGVPPAWAKLVAFGISGALAAMAGGMLAGARVQFGAGSFGPEESLRVLAMTIIGGLGSVGGAIVGSLYILGVPALLGDSAMVGLLTSGIGLLVLLLYLPGGMMQILYTARDALVRRAQRQVQGKDPRTAGSVGREGVGEREKRRSEAIAEERGGARVDDGRAALRVEDVTVRFGGIRALDGVNIEAQQGETVGLIGTNGAGKSSLLDVVSGFLGSEEGTVEFYGREISGLAPEQRAEEGVGRVFQDARLFEQLTVSECVRVALEKADRAEVVPAILNLPPARIGERRKEEAAEELIEFLGLLRYQDALIADLSTGTRRIAEVACLLALRPRVLLLDEPTAGVAQREAEAFGPLIKRVQDELGATMVVVEHDMPLVMSLADRVYCLESGKVIFEGGPTEARRSPAVINSYLGTETRTLERSDAGRERGKRREGRLAGADYTRRELLELARERGIGGVSRLRKRELIEVLDAGGEG